jgi:hypothetical protein
MQQLKTKKHNTMDEETREEMMTELKDLLDNAENIDLFTAFDDLMLDYGSDGDPTELLFDLI